MFDLPVLGRLAANTRLYVPLGELPDETFPTTPFVDARQCLNPAHLCSPADPQVGSAVIVQLNIVLAGTGAGSEGVPTAGGTEPSAQAGSLLAAAKHCIATEASDPALAPGLRLAAINALALSLSIFPLPEATRQLYGLLNHVRNDALEMETLHLPLYVRLAAIIDDTRLGPQRLTAWLAEIENAQPNSLDAGFVLGGILNELERSTRLLGTRLNTIGKDEATAWLARLSIWCARIEAAEGFLLGDAAAQTAELRELLDRLAARLGGRSRDFFGFAANGPLPVLRLLEYVGPEQSEPSCVFPDGVFEVSLLPLMAKGAPAPWLDAQPPLQLMVDVLGEDASLSRVANDCYDKLEQLPVGQDDDDVAHLRRNWFCRALAAQTLAATRQGCVEAAADMQSFLSRCISDCEQPEGVTPDDAWWICVPLLPHLHEILSDTDYGDVFKHHLTHWRTIDSRDHDSSTEWIKQYFRLWRLLAGTIQALHGRLLALSAPAWRLHTRLTLFRHLDALARTAEQVAAIGLLPADDLRLLRRIQAMRRLYRANCLGHFLGHPAARKRPVTAAATSSPAAVRHAVARPDTRPLQPITKPPAMPHISHHRALPPDALNNPATKKLIRENWSSNKAERLSGDLRLVPANPNAILQLAAEFPWMDAVINRVANRVRQAVLLGSSVLRLPPFLLVGDHGCGKTRFARRLAEVQHLPWRLLAAGGSTDNRQLAGTARGWSNACPSLPVDFMAASGVANGLLIIDEVDKESSSSHNGRLTDTLLQLLEPVNAAAFDDPFLDHPVDCSALNWVLCANSLATINPALLSRTEILHVRQPTPDHYSDIAAAARAELAQRHAVDARLLPPLTGEDIDLIKRCCRSAREVRRLSEELLSQKLGDEVRERAWH